MKFSVVTISFNQAAFLEETILSVLNQKEVNLEYIVVDPGSTDGSRDIIERYRNRISKIVYERDDGPADGLNKGFLNASGDIYAYLNSDDVLVEGALARVASYFSNKNIDVVYGNGYIIDESGSVLRKCYSDKFTLLMAAYGSAVVIQPSTFFKAEVFKNTKFNTRNKSNWDGELFIDMVLGKANIIKVSDFFSYYRVHKDGITGSGKLQDAHSRHSNLMFEKIMKRKKIKIDKYFEFFLKFTKHISNLPALYERLRYGPVFSRIKK